MGFTSFFGRVLFSSVFILSAWLMVFCFGANDFGTDGGPAVKLFEPKYNRLKGHIEKSVGVQLPEIEIKHLVSAMIVFKGIGGLLFIFGNTFGAQILWDFVPLKSLGVNIYISLKFIAVIYVIWLIYLATVTPILYDFYNYDFEKTEFLPVFSEFIQNLALFGALLFFLGTQTPAPAKTKKKTKTKTN